MPCQPHEEDMTESESGYSKRRPKPTKKNRDRHGEEDADDLEYESEENDEAGSATRRRKWNGRGEYRLVKRWVTGECAEMEDSDIQKEIFDLSRAFMEESMLKMIPTHVPNETDIGLWKLYREYTQLRSGTKIRLYRCPLNYRCGCDAKLRVTIEKEAIQLDFCGVHTPSSHDDDKSKYLKHNQIVALKKAVTIAPNQSACHIRRNLQRADDDGSKINTNMIRSVRHRVKVERVRLTTDLLSGCAIDDSFGALTKFGRRLDYRRLIDQHNDKEHEFHFNLFEPIVIGMDIQPHRDVVHLNVTSPWFLMNVFRSYESGWRSQLNGDTTFDYCRVAVDMIGLGVNSIGGHNNPLCWSIIPKGSEGSITYEVTYREVQEAAVTFMKLVDCHDDCAFCTALNKLRLSPDVKTYMSSEKYAAGKLHFDSAQCDNHLGWQKFAREELDLTANICKNHVLGALQFFYILKLMSL